MAAGTQRVAEQIASTTQDHRSIDAYFLIISPAAGFRSLKRRNRAAEPVLFGFAPLGIIPPAWLLIPH